MADLSVKYDAWLGVESDIAALVIREHLMPVEGADGVVFPATFAASEDKSKFPGGYNIDTFTNGQNVCLIDSVGSQSNRIEPLFALSDYATLIPQIVVKAGEKEINLLLAGHRAGDALVRCSALQKELQNAFKALQKGNAEPLAKIAPTSLVFGVWDSRDTQAKVPRLIASTIRAYNVQKLTRGAVYLPTLEYVKEGLIDEALDTGSGKDNPLSQKGFKHNPASASHGGVIANGGIRRDATLSLAALRLLSAGKDQARTLALRRYIFGLALTALTHPPASYLRQGCNLVQDPDKPREFVEVHIDGKRSPAKISHADALAFASVTANAFGVGTDRTVDFDTKLALQDVSGDAGNGDPSAKPAGKRKAK
jgi:CRISPR-associated protein Csb1